MRKIVTWVSVVAMLASCLLLLSACRHDDGTGKTFLFPLDAAPQRLDPAIAQTPDELLVVNNLFEGLVRVDADGEIIPGVAFAWTVSPDGLSYTFHLRQDTHWFLGAQAQTLLDESDHEFNTQVTAQDFAHAFGRVLDPATRSPHAHLFANFAYGIHVINHHTLQITLNEPDEAFLHTLTHAAAMPVSLEFFVATRGRFGLGVRYLLSNGPFYLSLWETNRLRLNRHEDYVGHEEVAPAAVNLLVQSSMNHRVNNLGVEGGWDAVFVPLFVGWREGTQVTLLRNATQVLQLNIANTQLRQALVAEISAPAIGLLPQAVRVGSAYLHDLAPFASPANGTVPVQFSGEQLRFLVPADQEFYARYMVQAWQIAFGLDVVVTIEVLEADDLQARVARGQFDLAFTTLYARESSARRVLQDWAARLYDGELEVEPTAQGIRAAETHLLEQAVVLPWHAQVIHLLVAEGVTGFSASSVGDNVWFGAMRK